ncbi:MAG TPA: MBL fold metallo-hydrolase [Candidatus Limnocylindria bacterium]|jgi:glyoxylase-like metal-dependent hydrolase (beta-lactamase superfamily II)|nr:MBL fold metallo-hydrolase [Candidatus Limnocylindria bacterium]
MRILEWRVAPYDNGTYIVHDDRREALVIDPAMGERQIMNAAKEQRLRIVEILNTHGHPDHIYGNAAVKEATNARLAIHRLDEYRLGPSAPPGLFPVPPSAADDLFDEGPLRYVADLEVAALHTPGHTEGSTCFYLEREGILFSGDLIFRGSTGRWDLPGGDREQLERSLERITRLPPDTKVYPGHGATTTIGAEISTLRQMQRAGILPGLAIR